MVLIDSYVAMRKRRAEDAATHAASRGDDDDRYILRANTLAVLLPSTVAERRRAPAAVVRRHPWPPHQCIRYLATRKRLYRVPVKSCGPAVNSSVRGRT